MPRVSEKGAHHGEDATFSDRLYLAIATRNLFAAAERLFANDTNHRRSPIF